MKSPSFERPELGPHIIANETGSGKCFKGFKLLGSSVVFERSAYLLTGMERTCATLAILGLTNSQIAENVRANRHVVRRELRKVYDKVGVPRRQMLLPCFLAKRMMRIEELASPDLLQVSAYELSLIEGIAQGLADQDIAAIHGIAPRTVTNDLGDIGRRTGLRGRQLYVAGALLTDRLDADEVLASSYLQLTLW